MPRQIYILLLALASADARALEQSQWMISGMGIDSCGSYMLALGDNKPGDAIMLSGKFYATKANAYAQWINGFITSVNLSRKSGQDQIQVDPNGVALWIKRYCEEHPDKDIVTGTSAFVLAHPPTAK